MQDFLSDYIFSVASKSRENIKDILSSAQVGKEDLDTIAQRLLSISSRAPFTTKPELYGGVINSVNLDSVSRDLNLRLRELYNESNLISLLLDTNTEVLSSEIQKFEDQLDSFDKFVDNYTFMLADEGFYDYSYTESFNDDLWSEEKSVIQGMLYDRESRYFNLDHEIAEIDEGSGTLVMSSGFKFQPPVNANILRSNCGPYVTSDTGIDKSTNQDQGQGWKVSLSSPRPVNSSLDEGTDKGAQFEIEYSLMEPSLCDAIAFSPLADLPVDIISIRIFNDESESTPTQILTSNLTLNRKRVINFPQQVVSKVTLIVNQPVFKQGTIPIKESEKDYAEAVEWQRKISRSFQRNSQKSNKAFQRLFAKWFLEKEKRRAKLVRAESNLSKYSDPNLSASDALSYQKGAYELYSQFRFDNRNGSSIFRKWLIDKLFAHQPEILGRFFDQADESLPNNSFTPVIDSVEVTENGSSEYSNYIYTLGLKSFAIGLATEYGKGLFVSRVIPAPAQSGEVRIKATDFNYLDNRQLLDNPLLTSIEYSVSNIPNPSKDSDWVPIIPANQVNEVANERLFPQSSGYCKLRFRVQSQESIAVYKNGIALDLNESNYVRSEDTSSVVGINLPRSGFSLNEDDIYTCHYIPEGDPTTVNFAEYGFNKKNIASAFDDNGVGELFNGTGNSLVVELSNFPYVDYNSIIANTSYSELIGLTGSYQPVTVLLQDGTIAYNYTNYEGLIQKPLKSEENLSFVHSNNTIVFNKSINQSFRVYYQYEPSYLRYRVIFRVNHLDKVSPKVDDLTIKAKINASVLGLNEKKV